MPVIPAYGMGMAIEDGFYLEKSLHGADLSDLKALKAGFADYEKQRVAYANYHTGFARKLGRSFHRTPWPLSAVRDFAYDNTKLLEGLIVKDYLKTAEDTVFALGLRGPAPMKLATERSDHPDGRLLIVSRDLTRAGISTPSYRSPGCPRTSRTSASIRRAPRQRSQPTSPASPTAS